MKPSWIATLVFVLLCAGCRHLAVNSQPPGAVVILDGQRVGTTPYERRVGRYSMTDFHVKLEKDGYSPYEMTCRPRLDVGSLVVSIVTTAGISMLFLSPQVYRDVDVDLVPIGQTEDPQKRAQRLLDAELITTDEYKKLAVPDPEVRLRELRSLKERGMLTEEEFNRLSEPVPDKH